MIDADALGLLHPELVQDLPGGAGRLVQRSTGYVETIVAGETVVAAGALTDARARDRSCRGPRAPRRSPTDSARRYRDPMQGGARRRRSGWLRPGMARAYGAGP